MNASRVEFPPESYTLLPDNLGIIQTLPSILGFLIPDPLPSELAK
ncbi:hypothetical protein GGP56_002698 [Salinibacter ruber]|nr:hypothetical protein [Salinibacter ruber]